MGLAAAGERSSCCTMTGQATGYSVHDMSMAVTVEVGGMATLAVLATGGSRSTTGKGAGTGVMTGKTG